jgi:hypothetical protein
MDSPEPVREGGGHDRDWGSFFTLKGVPNPDGELSPGIYCTVELKTPNRMCRQERSFSAATAST